MLVHVWLGQPISLFPPASDTAVYNFDTPPKPTLSIPFPVHSIVPRARRRVTFELAIPSRPPVSAAAASHDPLAASGICCRGFSRSPRGLRCPPPPLPMIPSRPPVSAAAASRSASFGSQGRRAQGRTAPTLSRDFGRLINPCYFPPLSPVALWLPSLSRSFLLRSAARGKGDSSEGARPRDARDASC